MCTCIYVASSVRSMTLSNLLKLCHSKIENNTSYNFTQKIFKLILTNIPTENKNIPKLF